MSTEPAAGNLPEAPATDPTGVAPAVRVRRPRRTLERAPAAPSLAAREQASADAVPRRSIRDPGRDEEGVATDRRRDTRLQAPNGLSARIWSATRAHGPLPILNLSAHGMLLGVDELVAPQLLRFELIGRAWRFTGHAHVIDRRVGSVALAIVAWDGHAHARVHEFVTRHLLHQADQ